MRTEPDTNRWSHISKVLDRTGPYCEPEFVPGEARKALGQCKVLVIGAGGLGCEILKNLALSGFQHLHVIDMDTIDVSNLNRQFLFRSSDVGRPKAIVAADFINKRVSGTQVVPYYGKIQDKDEEYYSQFDIVVCGLDSVEARRWINATLVNMAEEGNIKPLVDGGTEGFKGQARVIIPSHTSCYECSLDMLGKTTTYPICTIANTPRLPEHCIEWASVLEWPKVFKDRKLDNDDPDHITWLFETASARAKMFKIEGVTYQLTQGVVKNIIPAIASTNAVIAAACCSEVFKIATCSAPMLNNYMMYSGNDSIYTYTFEHQKREDCPVCGQESVAVEVGHNWSVQRFLKWIGSGGNGKFGQLKKPSVRTSTRSIYMQAPPMLETATRPNLTKPLTEFVTDGDDVTVTDASLPIALNLVIRIVQGGDEDEDEGE